MAGSGPDLGLRRVTQYGSSSVVGPEWLARAGCRRIVRLGERRRAAGAVTVWEDGPHALRLQDRSAEHDLVDMLAVWKAADDIELFESGWISTTFTRSSAIRRSVPRRAG